MFEKILPDLYRIEVPIPQNPLKAVNSYVIKSKHRSLIIDTGMNRPECAEALTAGLEELGIDLNKTDLFITHMHADHSGLASTLATETSSIYFSKADADVIRTSDRSFREEVPRVALRNGFPIDELRRAITNHPGSKYLGRSPVNLEIVREGDTIDIGDYSFKCIETPGHTKGHMCLYETDKKLFISGDHILIDITPNISLWFPDENPLNEYLASLDKVYDLDVRLVLPGHRRIFENYKERIKELKEHHINRTREILDILESGDRNAFQVASQMTWDLTYKSWDSFPSLQKWFATGEALAHLHYLDEKGEIHRGIENGEIIYSLM